MLSRIFTGVKKLHLFGNAENFTAAPFAWPSLDFLRTTFLVNLTTGVRHLVIGANIGLRLDRSRPSVLECEANPMLDVVKSGDSVKFLQLAVEGFVENASASRIYGATVRGTSNVCRI